jgi:hypothetical protein
VAGVTRIEIETVQSPAFGGASFGDIGRYELLRGRAFGEVDPADPRNSAIADLDLAGKNARGRIEYATDLYILRPMGRSAGNGRVFCELNNRGSLRCLSVLNAAGWSSAAAALPEDAGNGFLMRQGYTIVSSGWDALVPSGDGRLTVSVPRALRADGSPVVGLSLEEFAIDDSSSTVRRLTYAAATLDRSEARLTVRVRFADEPRPVPSSGWEYVDERSVRLLPAGTAFERGRLYELCYPAKNPRVVGLGFAIQRDLASFLRAGAPDDLGNANPLSGVQGLYAFGISQPARFLHDFIQLGFNRDLRGARVFDGILNYLGGASGGFTNYRFAQTFRTHRQRIGRSYPELAFPFAYPTLTDPVTGETDGRLRRCEQSGTSPRIFEVNSANEYWAKAASLLHTDPLGTRDLPDPADVRFYLLSSFPHAASAPGERGGCQQPGNPLRAGATLRALVVALDQWARDGREPPPSEVPRIAAGTLVPANPQSAMGFPSIPGVTYSGILHEGDRLDFGPDFQKGILGTLPPRRASPPPYRALVPRTDADGNDVAGIRVVDVEVPVATYTGWALRAGPAAGDAGDGQGQKIDFARTRDERLRSGDPRASLEERYPTRAAYVNRVRAAAQRLIERRFLLEEDAARVVEAAQASSIVP